MHISYSFPPCHATLSIKKVLHLKNLLSLDEEPPVFWSVQLLINIHICSFILQQNKKDGPALPVRLCAPKTGTTPSFS